MAAGEKVRDIRNISQADFVIFVKADAGEGGEAWGEGSLVNISWDASSPARGT